ncbi:MAG: hypothetical protein ACTHJY_13620, partial [Rhizobiaceae bacterium]
RDAAGQALRDKHRESRRLGHRSEHALPTSSAGLYPAATLVADALFYLYMQSSLFRPCVGTTKTLSNSASKIDPGA